MNEICKKHSRKSPFNHIFIITDFIIMYLKIWYLATIVARALLTAGAAGGILR
jgi:hypothetical protein